MILRIILLITCSLLTMATSQSPPPIPALSPANNHPARLQSFTVKAEEIFVRVPAVIHRDFAALVDHETIEAERAEIRAEIYPEELEDDDASNDDVAAAEGSESDVTAMDFEVSTKVDHEQTRFICSDFRPFCPRTRPR